MITSLLDGGAEGVLYRLCSHDKLNTHIVVSLEDKVSTESLSKSGIKIYTLNMKPEKNFINNFIQINKNFKKRKSKYSSIWLYHADFFGSIAAKLAGVKNLIWNVRHSDFNEKNTRKSLLVLVKILAKLSYIFPKKIVFCSKNSIKLHTKIGYQSKKISYIPNGYDLKKFRPYFPKKFLPKYYTNFNKNLALLGNVANFKPNKDHKNLLQALQILKKNKIPFKCMLVGKEINKQNTTLMNMIKKYNLSNEIILMGSQKNINRVMNKIDIHILSSDSGETFPNVVAEAMASGTPCVVTNVGDSSQIVGKTGWTVDPQNAKELAKSIKKAIRKFKSKDWNYLCLASRNRIVQNFTIKKMVNNYNKIWQQTLKN